MWLTGVELNVAGLYKSVAGCLNYDKISVSCMSSSFQEETCKKNAYVPNL